ncbi:unnamed protein product, partial [Meganyctiphanes norvegica]
MSESLENEKTLDNLSHKYLDATIYLNVKSECEMNEEPVRTQDVKIIIKEENSMNKEHMHIRTQIGTNIYKCSLCDKAYSKSSHLKRHMMKHTGEKLIIPKPYQCSLCNTSFAYNTLLVRHQTTHTGEKAYTCSQCDKAYSQEGDLKRHMRIHTGEDLYQCSQCDKVFLRNSELIIHMRRHTGETPYQCNVCGKGYSQNS